MLLWGTPDTMLEIEEQIFNILRTVMEVIVEPVPKITSNAIMWQLY